MGNGSRLLRASCIGAVRAATGLSMVMFVFFLFTPGDAGLSIDTLPMLLLFSIISWLLAFPCFFLGLLTVGTGTYVVMAHIGLTSRAWAAGAGGLITGLLGWSSVANYVTLTGTAIALGMTVGGILGALSFHRTVYQQPKPPPAQPS